MNDETAEQWLGNYLRHLAHDLVGPARNLQGFAQLVARHSEKLQDEKLRGYADMLEREAKRNFAMLTAAQTYGRLLSMPIAPEPLDLVAYFRLAWENTVRDQFPRATLSIDSAPFHVTMDKHHAFQLATELLLNGCIYVADRVAPVLHLSVQGNQLSLEDNGIGIDPAHVSGLTRLFTRLHPDTYPEGIGAGLAFCDAILGRAGGALDISPVAHGTRVSCVFIVVPI